MIKIFTDSKSEYEEMLDMVNKWQVQKNDSEYDIFVNPPRDSLAVVAWSIDDIIQALGEEEIDMEEIPEELLIEIIEELGLDESIHDSTISAGNEMITWEIGSILDLVKSKMDIKD